MNCAPANECKFYTLYGELGMIAIGPNAQCLLSGPRGGARARSRA